MPRGSRAATAVLLATLLLLFHASFRLSLHDAWLLLEHGPLTLRQPQASAPVLLPRREGEAFAYATLVNNAHYVHLCTVLAASLRASGSKYPLMVLALPEALREGTGIEALRSLDSVIVVPIRPLSITPNIRLDQAHWLYAFSKLRVWQMTNYTRLAYIDGDSLVLRNLDYLFTLPMRPGSVAAARDVHACNQTRAVVHMMSSLVVLQPSSATFHGLVGLMPRALWRNGDQQLIRAFFTRHGAGVALLNETDAAFVHRCRCADFGAGIPGTMTGPAVVHFTTAFAPTWERGQASTKRMEAHGWCKTRAGSVSCTGCADSAYQHWIRLRQQLDTYKVS
jgi:hypothetical protein